MNETIEYTHTTNVPLMRKMLEHITAHPEEHDQGVWGLRLGPNHSSIFYDCGTTACAAGWTCLLAGSAKWEVDEYRDDTEVLRAHDERGEWRPVWTRARDLLGLNDEQMGKMFYEAADRGVLWALANEYTQGEIEIPASMS